MSIFTSLTVLIADPENPETIEEWCRATSGFESIVATDVSDVSLNADMIYAYTFSSEETANWFRLRWL